MGLIIASLQIVKGGAESQFRPVVHYTKENTELRDALHHFRRISVEGFAIKVEGLPTGPDVIVQCPNKLLAHLQMPSECALGGDGFLRVYNEVHGPRRFWSQDEGFSDYVSVPASDFERWSTPAVKETYINPKGFVFDELDDGERVDSNPSALFGPECPLGTSQCIYGSLRRPFAGSGLDDGLVGDHLGLIRLVFHSIRKIFGPVGLFARGLSESMSIGSAGFHFRQLAAHGDPLKRNKEHRPGEYDKGRLSPAQRRALEGVHFTFNLFELFFGGWLCWWSADWLGCLDLRRTIWSFFALFGGLGLFVHGGISVTQKLLDRCGLSYYNNYMANVLNADKQIAIIGSLAEGSSIRSIERITGVHRDTIMRLGVRVGQGCTALMDAKMRNLDCHRLEMDEIWGFVGKKDRHLRRGDDPQFGNVWTFCAIDADTKLVPAFKVCKERDTETTEAFVLDVADRMKNRVQISTDGLKAYVDAIDLAFGGNVDYGQIVKTYGIEMSTQPQRRYSAPDIKSIEKKVIFGQPEFELISTSYIERLNATTRLHMKRLARLTHAFSKKRENFEAAVGLHFAYYNFVRRHATLRCTPAMAAGVTSGFWTVRDLLEAAA